MIVEVGLRAMEDAPDTTIFPLLTTLPATTLVVLLGGPVFRDFGLEVPILNLKRNEHLRQTALRDRQRDGGGG